MHVKSGLACETSPGQLVRLATKGEEDKNNCDYETLMGDLRRKVCLSVIDVIVLHVQSVLVCEDLVYTELVHYSAILLWKPDYKHKLTEYGQI